MRYISLLIGIELISCLVYSTASPAGTTIYESQGPNGVIEFSDQPGENSQSLSLAPLPMLSQQAAAPAPGAPAEGSSPSSPATQAPPSAAAAMPAQSPSDFIVRISSPANESHFGFADEWLSVQGEVSPAWDAALYSFVLFDNDQPLGDLQQTPTFSIHWLSRGSHSLSIHMQENASQKTVAQSPAITVYQTRPRVPQPGP